MLNDRDDQLFKSLLSFGFLSSHQIKNLLFPTTDKRTMLRRLRKLAKRKLLHRFEVSRGGEVLWYLTSQKVEQMGSTFVMKNINRNTLAHDLLVNDVRLQFEQKKLGSSWKSGHYFRHLASVNKKPEERRSDTIPDWVVTIGGRIHALEVELNFKSKDWLWNVFRTYVNNKAISCLWYIVPTEVMRKKLLRYVDSFLDYRDKNWFKVSLISEVEHELGLLTPHAHGVSKSY